MKSAEKYGSSKRKIRIYDSLRQTREELFPVSGGDDVSMYVCGLTPYDHPHLGHAFTAVRFEILRNYLEYRNLDVNFVTNVTDVEDKVISRSKALGEHPLRLSERFTESYFQGLAHFGVRPPQKLTKVSTSLDAIRELIVGLIERRVAYATEAGNVYFSIVAHPEYGKLSRQRVDELRVRVRDVEDDPQKRDPVDFALWKSDDSVLATDSPWGKGRPGWHIECSAMILEALGPTIDIHGGGLDLKFPHHENEIAQTEAYTSTTFANFWVHAGLLTIDGVKMSKSLGNFFTNDAALERFGPELLKFVMLRYHYRSQVDFSDKLFRDNLNSLVGIARVLERTTSLWESAAMGAPNAQLIEQFEEAMDNDFATPDALVALVQAAEKVQSALDTEEGLNSEVVKQMVPTMYALLRVLLMFNDHPGKVIDQCLKFSALSKGVEPLSRMELEVLLQERIEARSRKDYAKSDEIRGVLAPLGVEALDRRDGVVAWRFSS